LKVADLSVEEFETIVRRILDDYQDELSDANEALKRQADEELTAEEVRKSLGL
jgi:hypothetical protein